MKILIVDDHPLIRESLAVVLADLARDTQLVQADSAEAAAAQLAAHADLTLCLLDLTLPDAGGTSVLERVREARPDVPVVVLSASDDQATVLAAIDAGAMGFISKRSTSRALVNALRLVLGGEIYIPPEVLRAERAPRPVPSAPAKTSAELGLTPRQTDVLALLVQGKCNKLICRELGMRDGTLKTHISAIYRTLKVGNRTQAVFTLSRLGVQLPLEPGPRAAARAVGWRAAGGGRQRARLLP
jgi:DNA-binding NarL/FixJ family response regulator